ncbi:hypothetical protein ATERTT37_003977 [Aspergillus terreus]
MPPGRAVSPLSLETYSPPPSNNDIDEIVGSDEELDKAGRAAQRQRIQKLADAYNEGKPLFILSASLRGPFDDGWKPFVMKDGKDESGVDPTLEDMEVETQHGLQEKSQLDRNAQESATVENDSHTVRNTSKSDMGNSRGDTNPTGAHMSERMPSAQQVSGAPTMTGYVTSLHSTAAPKSNADEGKDPAPGATITPFRQLGLSTRTKETDHSKAPDTSRDQMLSTQYMINAATPFAFSTEKKSTDKNDYCLTSLKKPTGRGKQKATSFNLSTPSLGGNAPEPLKSGIERVPDSMPRRSPEVQGYATESQPTQDGQGGYPGADSFNLTQAIAEAGSWLQQSFDFTKDLQQRKDKSQPPASQDTRRSAFGLDIPG